MAEREKEEFVVTDRRKFRMDDGEITTVPRAEQEREPEPAPPPEPAAPAAEPQPETAASPEPQEAPEIPAPSAEDVDASQRAYQATSDRMDDVMRATNPGAPHDGPVTFERVIQSLYVTAIVQLGLNTPAGQQMRVDLIGARNTIDMLSVLAEKTQGNLSGDEEKLLQSALFELRMSFVEMTQAVARSAQAGKAAPATQPPGGGKVTL
jgi:Domain of unknown function (DUF1844)